MVERKLGKSTLFAAGVRHARATSGRPAPEVEANVNIEELADPGLTSKGEDAIVAFVATLSDGFVPPDRR